jgi:hypothetical protein
MEEHALAAASLQANRQRIRALVVPRDPADAADDDVFPRSAVMRFLLDSRKRKLAMAALTVVLMVTGRRKAAKIAGWSELAGSLGSLFGKSRR